MKIDPKRLRLYAVTDRAWTHDAEGLLRQVAAAVDGGAGIVQLREKHMGQADFLAEAERFVALCREKGAVSIINDNVEIAAQTGADGVHVGQEDLEAGRARELLGPDKLIGVSAHSVEEALAAQWAEALAKDEEGKESAPKDNAGLAGHATDAHFQDMTEMARQPGDNKLKRELDFILDIPLDVSAELGRTRLLINELLQLGQGSVVELNKLAGEPLEVYVNGKLVARGEAVVINEKFGVRLTDIISPIERVKQLG